MIQKTLRFDGAIEAMRQGVINGMINEYIPHIMPIINDRTPEDTGALKKSEKAEVFQIGETTRLEISANTDYAVYQHEIPNYMHKTGESGYILNPVNENVDEFMRIIAESINESLRNGGK